MTTVTAASVAQRHAHRDPRVLRWLGAYTSSMLGDNVYYLALSWAAVQAGTPAQAGLVMSVSALPRAVLMLGGGVIADRFGPRRVVIASDAVRCAAVLAVAALLLLTRPGLWPLALLALLFGTVDAVFMPAVGALPARITGPDQLARVQGMRGLAIRFAGVVGAPLGGLGVAAGGAAAAFGLAGLLIAVSLPLLISVPMRDLPGEEASGQVSGAGSAEALEGLSGGVGPAVPAGAAGAAEAVAADLAASADAVAAVSAASADAVTASLAGPAASPAPSASEAPATPAAPAAPSAPAGERLAAGAWRDLKAGLSYIRGHRVLAPLMLAIALGDLGFVGPLNVGLTLLADHRGWGATGMGWVLAGFGVGAGAVSLLLTVRGRLPRAGLVAGCACTTGAVAVGFLGQAGSLPAAVGTALLIGLATGLSGAMCGALLQTQGDPAYLGRVSSVAGLVSLGFAPLSMPFAAAAIGAWGLGPVYAVSAAVCGLGGLVFLCFPALRRAELPA
ncbi:MFS transporter [Streptomyces sp. NPDC005573]|uniref:MFS transporter n=1 Tax=Streptomyces sp. NPDC005573 TaxID=3156890 RepID=UPI0033B1AF75